MGKLVMVAKTADEYERIFRFRYAIYVQEMGKPIAGADHSRCILRDDLDDRSTHLYVQREGSIIGAIRITWGADGLPDKYLDWYWLNHFTSIPKEEISFTGRLMVSEKCRNSTASFLLAQQAYIMGRERGISFDFVHTTPNLFAFVERYGYRRYTPDFIDPDLGVRTPMVLLLSDLAHLEACQSPFLSLAMSLNHHRPEHTTWFKNKFNNSAPQ